MAHFIAVTDPVDGVVFAQSPIEEDGTRIYIAFGADPVDIPESEASRTFDWAWDQAWEWAAAMGVPHQAWHIHDGVVTEYTHATV